MLSQRAQKKERGGNPRTTPRKVKAEASGGGTPTSQRRGVGPSPQQSQRGSDGKDGWEEVDGAREGEGEGGVEGQAGGEFERQVEEEEAEEKRKAAGNVEGGGTSLFTLKRNSRTSAKRSMPASSKEALGIVIV